MGAQCLLSSLPGLFGAETTNIPAQHSYLTASAPKPRNGRQRLARHSPAGHLKIGLVWGGSPDNKHDFKRSLSFEQFAPFGGLEGVSLFSLQVRDRARGPAKRGWPGWIVDLGDDIRPSFEDTMGVLANLDLVITVDTSIAHLAGAMGVKTFVLLSFSPGRRWLLDRSDTPWYPSLRLFRQPHWQD